MSGQIICSVCSTGRESSVAKNGQPRIPRGWKRIAGKVFCPKCKKAQYALRAVTIPVATCDWGTVMPLLRTAWRDGVRCANWLLTQYYQRDTIAADASPKLPTWRTPYLYPDARKKFPELEPTVLVSIINTVSAKYKASRFDLWRGASSLPVYRELPIPIPAQNWQLSSDQAERTFSARVNGERYIFRLRRDRQFHRQHATLDHIIGGDIEAGEAALYQQGSALMLKIAAWFARGEKRPDGATIKARTCADGFLVAMDGEVIWRLNADHVKSWIVGHAVQQQRLREDLKAERRFPNRMREGITQRMADLSELRHHQLSSWMHEASTQLVNWAQRRHAARLIWDDSYPSMLPKFPWHMFAARIKQKCEMVGIEFIRASKGVVHESPAALAESGSVTK